MHDFPILFYYIEDGLSVQCASITWLATRGRVEAGAVQDDARGTSFTRYGAQYLSIKFSAIGVFVV